MGSHSRQSVGGWYLTVIQLAKLAHEIYSGTNARLDGFLTTDMVRAIASSTEGSPEDRYFNAAWRVIWEVDDHIERHRVETEFKLHSDRGDDGFWHVQNMPLSFTVSEKKKGKWQKVWAMEALVEYPLLAITPYIHVRKCTEPGKPEDRWRSGHDLKARWLREEGWQPPTI